jgi:hypothetical protein
MVIRSLVIVVLVAGCRDDSDAKFHPDAEVWRDAHEVMDARVFPRVCTSKKPVFFQGTENLTIAFVCATSSDNGLTVGVTVEGGSGSGAEAKVIPLTLTCAANGIAYNNPLPMFMATQPLLATNVTGGLLDVDCDPPAP